MSRIAGTEERFTHGALRSMAAAESKALHLHVSADDYRTLETTESATPASGGDVPPSTFFSLRVDDGRYDQASDSSTAKARTDFLLVAVQGALWLMCERVAYVFAAGRGELRGHACMGVIIDQGEGRVHPFADGSFGSDVDDHEYRRIASVAMGFVARYQAGDVQLKPYADTLGRQRRRAAERAGRLDGFRATLAPSLSIAPPSPTGLWTPRTETSASTVETSGWFVQAKSILLRSTKLQIA